MSEIRGMGREALLYALAKVINGAAGFAAIYIFTRLLLPEDYGYYYVILSAVEITSGLCFAWINLSLVRFYPGTDTAEMPVFLGRLLAANVLVSGLLIAVALVCMPVLWWMGHPVWLPLVVLSIAIPQSWLGFAQNLFRSQRRPLEWLLTASAMSVGRLLLGWWVLSAFAATGLALVLVQSIAVFGAALYGVLRLGEAISFNRDSFRWREFTPVLKYGLPLSLVISGSWLLVSSGRLVLAALAGTAAVGIFAAAYQLTLNLLQIAVQPITLAAETVSYRMYEKEGLEATRRYMQNFVGLLFIAVSSVGVVLYVLRYPIINTLIEEKYAPAVELMVWLIPALLLVQLTPSLSRSFQYVKRTYELSRYTLIAGVVNLALNFALVPALAQLGSAMASMFSYVLYSAVMYVNGLKHLSWPLPWKTVCAMAVPAAAIILINSLWDISGRLDGLLITAAASVGLVALYLVLAGLTLIILRNWTGEQLEFIKHIFRARAEQS